MRDEGPLHADWRRGKTLARCRCTDASPLMCINMAAPNRPAGDGKIACACRCHGKRSRPASKKDAT